MCWALQHADCLGELGGDECLSDKWQTLCTTTSSPGGGGKVLCAGLHQVKHCGDFNPFPHPCSKNILLVSETKNCRT